MNMMYAMVAQRTREIGVLRVLGFGSGDLLAGVLGEGVILGFAAAIIGEILGVAVAFATGLESRLMNVGLFGGGTTLGDVMGGQGYMQVTPMLAVAASLATTAIALISATLPVVEGTKVSPALAFRKVV